MSAGEGLYCSVFPEGSSSKPDCPGWVGSAMLLLAGCLALGEGSCSVYE